MPDRTLAFAETVLHDDTTGNSTDKDRITVLATLLGNGGDDIHQTFPPLPSLNPTLRDNDNEWELIELDSQDYDKEDILSCDSADDSNSTMWIGRRTYAETAICAGVHHDPIRTAISSPSTRNTKSNVYCRSSNDAIARRAWHQEENGQCDSLLYDHEYADDDSNDPYYQIKSVLVRKLHHCKVSHCRQRKALKTAFRHHTITYQKQQQLQQRENKQLLYYENALKTAQKYLETCIMIGERLLPHYYFTGRDNRKRAHVVRLTKDHGLLLMHNIYKHDGPPNNSMYLKQMEQELANPHVREIIYDLLEDVVGKAIVPWAWSGHMDDATIKSWGGREVNYVRFYYIKILFRICRQRSFLT
ncbi:hypothetical protein BDB00DRAFT_274677 [Zychaea mexicana]|uniref:uncharacterized protein n=1 Tax=Zychaea mexicana TaxID=64656 RepID=UPI0022FE8785|nr:uncharacterized protein BDB00DRAFT_274677 [Zychaea mexicana]KAI9468663.1 hypothetical protein BDB00DRAFT_274677 [Zychaea mexicana]